MTETELTDARAAPDRSRVTEELAEWAAKVDRSALPSEAVEAVQALLFDFLRSALAGAGLRETSEFFAVVRPWIGEGRCRLLFSSCRTDPCRAALLNGYVARVADVDHSHVGSMMHPGAAVFPAAFAVAEAESSDGAALLSAAVSGLEVAIRIGTAVQPSHFRRGFEATSTCGVFGAAAASGRLMGLSPGQMVYAFGIAGSLSAGISQFYRLGSRVSAFHAGRAAESGVLAAYMAKAGLTGPTQILEGQEGFGQAFSENADWGRATVDLGVNFRLTEASIRVHSTSARLQSTVQAIMEMVAESPVNPGDAEQIKVSIPRVIAGRLTDPEPAEPAAAQLSLPFTVGLALVLAAERGPNTILTTGDYEGRISDDCVRQIAARTEPVIDDFVDRLSTEETVPSVVEILMKDGHRRRREVLRPLGSPVRQLEWGKLRHVLGAGSAGRLDATSCDELLHAVARLETGDAPGLLLARVSAMLESL